MSSPYSLSNFLNIPASFNGESAVVIFDDYFDVLVYIEVAYILLVWYGPKLMEKREPFQLKGIVAAWNLLLTLFALGGFMGTGSILMHLVRERGVYGATCHFDKNYIYDGELSFWIFAFLVSKPPEMLDTVFLILQKKPVIFLHWFHHLTVTIFCWYAGRSLIPSGFWYATMNYGVHSVMYMYYFLCTLGLRKYIRSIAPIITGAQLAQMFAGTGMVLYTWYYSYISPKGCAVDRRTIRMGLAMYGTYVFLFAALFARLYLNKGKRGARSRSVGHHDSANAAAVHGKRIINGRHADGAAAGAAVRSDPATGARRSSSDDVDALKKQSSPTLIRGN